MEPNNNVEITEVVLDFGTTSTSLRDVDMFETKKVDYAGIEKLNHRFIKEIERQRQEDFSAKLAVEEELAAEDFYVDPDF